MPLSPIIFTPTASSSGGVVDTQQYYVDWQNFIALINGTIQSVNISLTATSLSASSGGIASGTNTLTLALSPPISSYSTGLTLWVACSNANTTSVTLNVNSLGAATVQKYLGGTLVNLEAADIAAGDIIFVIYNGTVWQLVGVLSGASHAASTISNPWLCTPATSRAFATVYQNLNPWPVYVSVEISMAGNGTTTQGGVQIVCDSSSSPSQFAAEVLSTTSSSSTIATLFLVVPQNWYYEINNISGAGATATLGVVRETRIA